MTRNANHFINQFKKPASDSQKHTLASSLPVEEYARAAHENYRRKRLEDGRRAGLTEEELNRLMLEDNMADWERLKEIYKEDNRAQIRYLEKRFQDPDMGIGIRPIVPDAPDGIRGLDGSLLEALAEAEHERWMQNKKENGWTLGSRDNEEKRHPDLVPYGELTESVKDYDRAAVQVIPKLLEEIGYELYRRKG